MALVTHQIQVSHATFPLRPIPWTKGFKLKHHVSTLHMSGRTDRLSPVKRNTRLSLGACINGSKVKLFKIASFKGSSQNDEPGNRANGFKGSKNSVKVSYVPKESGETIIGSPKVHGVPVSYTSEANERIGVTPAINRLFKKWLSILSSPSSGQLGDEEIVGEKPSSSEESQPTESNIQTKERGEILKAVWCHFLRLDATIKIPLLIFAPLYVAVNMIYGAQVSKELTPLWIMGPAVVVLYIKMAQLLWALYVVTFKQTVKLIKNSPTYFAVAWSYIAQGKLKEDVFGPVIRMKNLDYKELSKKKMKEFQEWLIDKYLDYVESIWPYYCGAIRFLKRANLL